MHIQQSKYNTHVVESKGTLSMEDKILSTVNKRNTLRHQAAQKAKRLEQMKQHLHDLELEEAHQEQNSGGASTEMQQLRTLENRLDKATIKFNEAQHVGKTYKQIISKLEQDRLHFDNSISGLEKTLDQRKEELIRLEVCCMYSFKKYYCLIATLFVFNGNCYSITWKDKIHIPNSVCFMNEENVVLIYLSAK